MERIARIVLGIASPLVVLACLVGGETGGWLFGVVAPLIPVALIALGVSRRRRGRGVAWVLIALTLTLEAGSVGVLLLSGSEGSPSLIAGLPAATLVMLIALGVVPLLLIPVGYALLFGTSREP